MANEFATAASLDDAVVSVRFFAGVVISLGGAAVSVLAYVLKRQDARLTQVEKDMQDKVSVRDYNATLEALRRDIKEQGALTHEQLSRLSERVDKWLELIIKNGNH